MARPRHHLFRNSNPNQLADFLENGPNADAQRVNINTGIGDLSLTGPTATAQRFNSVEDLVKGRTQGAIDLLKTGSSEGLRLSDLARQEAVSSLEQFSGRQAFNEEQALLGTLGEEAQEAAIGNLPVSEFDRELQRRAQTSQARLASARGDLGSGAAIQEAQQLGGAIQSANIQKRLDQLSPLAQISRNVSSDLATIDENARFNEAQQISGLGTQLANVRLGSAAPQIESTLNRAELKGLQGIASARNKAQIGGQLAQLAGRFTPEIENAFNPPTESILV